MRRSGYFQMTTAEIQKVTFNREYKLDLTDFDDAALKFGEESSTAEEKAAAQKYFEDTLVAKIFGLERVADNEGQVAFKRYTDLKYKIMYAPGNGGKDTNKCIFGIVSDVKASINSTYAPSGVTNPTFEPGKKYMFVFAHKSEDITATPAVPAQNILRVHEIVDCPNTHFVAPSQDPANGKSTGCGLFAGPSAPIAPAVETNCILGFFAVDDNGTETQFFYLPAKSYCLEGKSLDFLTLPDSYTGRFKINTSYSSDRTSSA